LTATRPLRQEERILILSMLSRVSTVKSESVPLESHVEDMQDSKMCGIRFISPMSAALWKRASRGEYQDSDGVLVSVTINADDHGDVFELDSWKVEFSPLKRYPRPEDVVVSGWRHQHILIFASENETRTPSCPPSCPGSALPQLPAGSAVPSLNHRAI